MKSSSDYLNDDVVLDVSLYFFKKAKYILSRKKYLWVLSKGIHQILMMTFTYRPIQEKKKKKNGVAQAGFKPVHVFSSAWETPSINHQTIWTVA